MPLNSAARKILEEFVEAHRLTNIGGLGTCLVLTRKASESGMPLVLDDIATAGGGQVSGLSGKKINKILRDHNVVEGAGTESGRTSRGTLKLGQEYAELLSKNFKACDLWDIEAWWAQKFEDYFNNAPFTLKYDVSKTLANVIQELLDQAVERQKKFPSSTFAGAMLQHLVGAKLSLALPLNGIRHHGHSVTDSVSGRAADFNIEDVAIHCTTSPATELLRKCVANIAAGLKPMILTLPKRVQTAINLADDAGIGGRVEIMDAIQFLTANLYEMSGFKMATRKLKVDALIDKYNEIIDECESNQSLKITPGE